MERKRILVVDDSKTCLLMESVLLSRGPYELLTATDGEDAVQKAIKERPDLILMDVVMPRKTGLEACRELKSRADTRDIPIILVTTRGEGENVEAGYESGCADYITKPVNGSELLAKIKDCVGT